MRCAAQEREVGNAVQFGVGSLHGGSRKKAVQEPALWRVQFTEDPERLAAWIARDEVVAKHRAARWAGAIPPTGFDPFRTGHEPQRAFVNRCCIAVVQESRLRQYQKRTL